MNQGNKVNAGAAAGALATIGWWVFSIVQPDIITPDAVVAASVVILGYIVSAIVPDELEG